MKIARVFPRRTNATPVDRLTFFGPPPRLFPPEVEEVHVSVAFTWDLEIAQMLARAWEEIAPVRIGGPGTGMRGEEFEPGRYLRRGYVITSRGCPNRCWYCSVPDREGNVIRELPIVDGYNILDDNLLACSTKHISDVVDMLCRQKERPEFTGGLEARRLTIELAEAIRSVMPKQVFFAYDKKADWDPLVRAADLCWRVGFTPRAHRIRAFVLCGYPRDTIAAAERRLLKVMELGVIPHAMLWRDARTGQAAPAWARFQRRWARPAIAVAAEVVG